MNHKEMIGKLNKGIFILNIQGSKALQDSNYKQALELFTEVRDALKSLPDFIMNLLPDEEYEKELELLLKYYTPFPEEWEDLSAFHMDECVTQWVNVDMITEWVKSNLHPSKRFIETFGIRLEALPEPGGDFEEYAQWAHALGVDDSQGETIVYQLQIQEWQEYYEILKEQNQ